MQIIVNEIISAMMNLAVSPVDPVTSGTNSSTESFHRRRRGAVRKQNVHEVFKLFACFNTKLFV